MKSKGIKYQFGAVVWRYEGPASWYFVSLPIEMAQEIRTNLKWQEEGWGRLKSWARIGRTEWETAIWFDTKQGSYLLPLKAEIRAKERIQNGATVQVEIWI